jgi:hypothetical protein
MHGLFLFTDAVKRHPAVEAWLAAHGGPLGEIANLWFGRIRNCGDDVCELIHDGQPTACLREAAFAYVGSFNSHVNVGFFRGAELADPAGLLQGTGKLMRHVKLGPDREVDEKALLALIDAAYADMRRRLNSE